jgi:4-amino-4-deoxy-L-arabinose transferase-like glycosyltransferase
MEILFFTLSRLTCMAIVLILISLVSMLGAFYFKESSQNGCLRISLLKTIVIHACLIVTSTEALSLMRSLNFNHVAFFWFFVALINLIAAYFSYRHSTKVLSLDSLKVGLRQLTFSDWFSIITAIVILAISLAIALIAPPNNWDSMTYHMPRVMHWIQNETVAHYPTNNLRQISLPPGASFLVTHLQLLSGGDRFANCVQWLAFLGSILGVSLITKELVGDQAQWISLLLCASIPMAIAQSTTTQTDLVVAFWLVCFTYFLLRLTLNSKSDLFWVTASASLAIATKPTAIIFGIPLLLAFSIRLFVEIVNLSSFNFLKASITTFCTSLVIVTGSIFLSLPSFARNYQTFGSLFGSSFITRSEIYGIPPLISNFLKNLCLNFTLPGFPQLVALIHQFWLGIGVDDPRLTLQSSSPFFTGDGSRLSALRLLVPHEDKVANPIHLILAGVACWFLFTSIFFKVRHQKRDLFLVQISTIAGFLIFCCLLKWQVWGNRLMLPLFVMQTPILAYLLSDNLGKIKAQWRSRILILLAGIAVFYALTPIRRPLISLAKPLAAFSNEPSASILTLRREDIYFSGAHKDLEVPYQKAVSEIVDQSQCRKIGFAFSEDDWEYPLWILLKDKTAGSFRFRHVQVQNESSQLTPEFPDSELCAIVDGRGKVQILTRQN